MAYTTIDNPELYFQAKAWTGTGNEIAITFDGSENMQPDWVWLKRRDASSIHVAHDSVRGATKRLIPNSTDAETTQAQYVKSFDSNGITFGTDTDVNNSGSPAILWGWKSGGSASSNSNGSITSSVSASTDAGFSIVSYTGNGSAGATIGHGLGAIPQVYILKNRSSSAGWTSYFEPLGATKFLQLDTTGAAGTTADAFNNTSPTSSVFSIGTDTSTNNNTDNFIAYCFAEKKGYSKIGSYVGNGSLDAPFIYTGMKVSWLLIKETTQTRNWVLYDNKRVGYNPNQYEFLPDTSNAEDTSTTKVDLLSNGFKIRSSHSTVNQSGETYIYMAFAESPFVTSSGVPTCAR